MINSKQLEPFYNFNPKLSVSALRIFLRVAEAGIPGVHQVQLSKLLNLQQSTTSRQLSILCSRTEKHCPGALSWAVSPRTTPIQDQERHERHPPHRKG
jgi:hypothetical protein